MFFTGSSAQKIWSLEDCIMYAYDNNISIKQQVLNAQYNENLFKQSKINLAPDLNAGANHRFNYGYVLDPLTYQIIENELEGI